MTDVANGGGKVLVSIVMPMYNQERYIEKCLRSVLKQSLRAIEVVLVNDGSTDSSMTIVRRLANEDSRVVIVDKPNTGYGNSVNEGIRRSHGQYIGIVETDDFISPEMYETLYGLSGEGIADVVKGNFYDYWDYAGKDPVAVENTERHDMPDVQTFFTIRECPQILWGHPSVWSAIYRREFLLENNISFKEVAGSGWVDNPFFFETLCKAEKIRWTKKPLYYYRKTNPNSSSNIVNPNLPFDRMNDNLDVIESCGYTDDVTLKYLYSRALMYSTGALKECDYAHNKELIDSKAKQLMQRCDVDVFYKYFNARVCFNYHEFTSPFKTIAQQFPKILIYNWLPYDNPWNWGGGVTVYCRNVVKELTRHHPFVQVFFLSSGFVYSSERDETFIREIGSQFSNCRQFEIVNSPVPAAQDKLFVNPTVAIENEVLKETFRQFIEDYGPFSAIHFNNIEGISHDVLDLKRSFVNTKFIYSMHNYVPICLTGFYYQRHKHHVCCPEHTAKDCILCSRVSIRRGISDELYKSAQFNVSPEKQIPKEKWLDAFGFRVLDEDVSTEDILSFSDSAIKRINENCDVVLAVSDRVRKIAVENGIDEAIVVTSYIGTEVAKRQVRKSLYGSEDGLKVVFLGSSLGYEEKGYPFLLGALEKMDAKHASKIDLVLTVRDSDYSEITRRLVDFRSVNIINGYTHDTLGDVLKGCNLSIVPVLWEDNLPQIAIESVAYGIPVLSSDLGGASELTDVDLFRFRGGDVEDFLDKIIHFVDCPDDLNLYWRGHNGLVTMGEHVSALLDYYGLTPEPDSVSVSMQDYALLLMENDFLKNHVDYLSVNQKSKSKELQEELSYIDSMRPYEGVVCAIDKYAPVGTLRRRILKKLLEVIG